MTVRHLPILECRVDTKAEPLPKEPNPILTMIQVATKLFAGGGAAASCTVTPVAAPAKDDEAARIEAQLGRLRSLVTTLEADPAKYYARHESVATRIRRLARCETGDGKPACTDAHQFGTVRATLEADLRLLLDEVPPST